MFTGQVQRRFLFPLMLAFGLVALGVGASPFSRKMEGIKNLILDSPGDLRAENRLFEIFSLWDLVPPDEMQKTLEVIAARTADRPLLQNRAEDLWALASLRRGEIEAAKESYRHRGFIARWLVIGPFGNEGKEGFEKPYPPETDGKGVVSLAEPMQGKERPVHWRPLPDIDPFGYVHLESVLHPNVNSCGYALAYVKGEERRKVQVWVGGGGAFKMWWNGRPAIEDPLYREGSPDRFGVEVSLEPGWNRLLIKSCSMDGAWGFFARIADENGQPVQAEVSDDPARSGEAHPPAGPIRRLESTLDLLERRLTESPDDPAAMADLAEYLLETGGSDPASHRDHDLAYRTVEIAPQVDRCILWADLSMDDNEERRALEKALSLDPENPEALTRLAALKAEGWRPVEAVPLLRRALARSPDYYPARLQILRIEAGQGLALSAWRKAEREAALLPDTALVVDTLGTIARQAGLHREEERLNRKYLSFWFTDLEIQKNLISLAVQRNDPKEVSDRIDRLLAASPFELNLHIKAAEAWEGLGRPDVADKLLTRAAAIAPHEAEIWAALGLLRVRQGDTEAGIDAIASALALKPQDAVLREYLNHLRPELKSKADEYLLRPEEFLKSRGRPSEGAHARVLSDIEVVEIFPNGLGTRTKQTAVEILSEEGAREWRQFQISYESDIQRVRIERARVYRKDGTEGELAGTYTYPLSEPWYRMYYDIIGMVLDLPPLEAGDVVEIFYRTDDIAERNMFNDYFGDFVPVQDAVDKDLFRYVLIAPKSRPLYFNGKGQGGLVRSAEERGDETRTVFEWKGVPRLQAEDGMPGYGEAGAYIHVSTYTSWEEMGRWYRGLVSDQLKADEKIRSTVKSLVAGLSSDLDKARAIHDWVARNTRYVALEFGIHGYQPYPASVVMARGFGDCKDKASLLSVMLREAGVPAEMVMARTRRLGRVDPWPASLAIFNHAIVYVPSLDLWLDGTAEYNGTGELPFEDQGIMALRVGSEAVRLVIIPVSPAKRNHFTQVLEGDLQADGAARLSGQWTIEGASASMWRQRYESEATRESRFSQDLGEFFPGVKVEALKFDDLKDIEKPVSLRYSAHVPRFARLEAPGRISFPAAPELHMAESSARLSARRFDLELGPPWEGDLRVKLRLPPGSRAVEVPASAGVSSPFGELQVEVKREGSVLEVRRYFRVDVEKVTIDRYGEWRKFCIDVDDLLSRKVVILMEK